MDSGASMFEYFSERPAITATIISVAAAGLAMFIYMIKNKR